MRANLNGTRLSRLVEDFQWRIVASKMLEVLMSGLLQPSGAFRSSLDPSRSARGDSCAASSRDELAKPGFEIRADRAREGCASLCDRETGMRLLRATASPGSP